MPTLEGYPLQTWAHTRGLEMTPMQKQKSTNLVTHPAVNVAETSQNTSEESVEIWLPRSCEKNTILQLFALGLELEEK
jgi:hypothetical protein